MTMGSYPFSMSKILNWAQKYKKAEKKLRYGKKTSPKMTNELKNKGKKSIFESLEYD